ncbi:MAG: DEAD/DEAH box helicase [Candidatus Nealsonbacteria bacterium]|nr:DEAD/DEAH box helicase [Candidatus Nealsonbacteria bacterium]
MDIFQLHSEIVRDYRSYIESFINIRDDKIREVVERSLLGGRLWPEPMLQFNPAFETVADISEVIDQGLLSKELKDIFWDMRSGEPYRLYQHQLKALKLGAAERDFIVTSGTGSGKSLTFIGTVFNHLFKTNSFGSGVQAVFVYPMNALINSQVDELDRYAAAFEKRTGTPFPVRYASYTGQLREDDREPLRESPPDIFLTNYMMLELILTRHREHVIRDSIFEHLRFLVFDELHTYRGRQGADVGMLVRRIRAKSTHQPVCIGTSATMVSGDSSVEEQKQEVANVASQIFGAQFESEQIINETLTKSFSPESPLPSREELTKSVETSVDFDAGPEHLSSNPGAIWLESRIALTEKDGDLVRNVPRTFLEIANSLSEDTGHSVDHCSTHLRDLMQWINLVNERNPDSRYTYLPFKLHQFFAQTGSVYTSLSQADDRIITMEPGIFKTDDRGKTPIFPNAFSRGSGHAFICVYMDTRERQLLPREFNDTELESASRIPGYVIVGEDVWNPAEDRESMPESWFKVSKSGEVSIVKKYEDRIPQPVSFDESGNYSVSHAMDYTGWFMSCPLLFDPTSGQFFDPQTNESTKLTRLGNEGRSTSTTITAFSILSRLSEHGYLPQDQKLLSFTDNRQDAALQSGHFNDFIKVVQLRSAICNAVETAPDGQLTYTNLGDAIFNALKLDFREYANYKSDIQAAPPPPVLHAYHESLKKYLVYLALYDLRRGWRVVLPNLEQCALLKIDYAHLDDIAAWDEGWATVPPFNSLPVSERRQLLFNVLDLFRLEYAIYSENYLTEERIRQNKKEIEEKLIPPWKFEEADRIDPYYLRYDTLAPRTKLYTKSVGLTSALGKFIRQRIRQIDPDFELKRDSYLELIVALLDMLEAATYLTSRTAQNRENKEVKVYQLRLDKIIWLRGDRETVAPDVVKRRTYKAITPQPNRFFQQVYLRDFSEIKRLIGGDHTGQLSNEQRIDREERFRADFRDSDGKPDLDRIMRESVSALFCSPTMELGIDIRNLNVVHMRNAPPNPANYAQRGGRAGRGGQAALVFTYCSSFSNHDRHYFRNQQKMVAGTVLPPRIDLCNKELLTSHLHAVFLSEVGLKGLDYSLLDIIDEGEAGLPLTMPTQAQLQVDQLAYAKIRATFQRVIRNFEATLTTDHGHWYSEQWIDKTLANIGRSLDSIMDRWRRLYRQAKATLSRATQEIESGTYSLGSKEYKQAKRNQDQATRQLDLLKNDVRGRSNQLSEFYPYRFLASEGFLPGYNFTRLPLRVFIPMGDAGEYISRPRFMALREFGPGNVIYYNGQKYEIRQLIVQDAENHLQEAKISLNAGYFLRDNQKDLELCPFTGVSLSDNQQVEYLHDLLEMCETRAAPRARISCEEEERLNKGFQIDTYFSVADGAMNRVQKAVLKSGEDEFLHLHFIPAANLIQVNRKWKSSEKDGFTLGMMSGFWKTGNLDDRGPDAESIRNVKLITTDTADALYIEPIEPLGLDRAGVITLQYALKRAIERIFLIESSELAVVSMGRADLPNIFLYEAAEGSLGILSQFVKNVDTFQRVVNEAISLLRYDDPAYRDPASYDDLLSYYNQRDHPIIDRFLIQDALGKLRGCKLERQTSGSHSDYDSHYQTLRRQVDPNSSTEVEFLDYLYQNDLRLPDAAQRTVDGIYVQPDFFYEPDVWVFCDGTPHDKPDVRLDDEAKRQAILNRGEQVFVYYYKDDLATKVASRLDIFTKVR